MNNTEHLKNFGEMGAFQKSTSHVVHPDGMKTTHSYGTSLAPMAQHKDHLEQAHRHMAAMGYTHVGTTLRHISSKFRGAEHIHQTLNYKNKDGQEGTIHAMKRLGPHPLGSVEITHPGIE